MTSLLTFQDDIMINIVLAAGYATRLYPLTENFPKPLLEIGGTTILDRMMADIDGIPEITGHIIVSNHKFIDHFNKWLETAPYEKPITIIDDGSTDNEHRIGAVNDLLAALEIGDVKEDIMVVAADNVLDFSFDGFVEYFKEKQTSLIMCHQEPSLKALQKTGVVCLDADNLVTLMEEKPHEPKSNWAVPPFYIYRAEELDMIRGAVDDGCGYDAPGNLAHYMCERTPMHAYPMPGRRHDIGDMESYNKVKALFE